MKTQKIIIVGGGIEGWMTAATLIHFFPKKEITLIEKPNPPLEGIGESISQTINNWLALLGIKDKEFMKAANATYRLSTEFKDFYKKNEHPFHYPCGLPCFEGSHFWFNDWVGNKILDPSLGVHTFSEYFFPVMQLVLKNTYYENKDMKLEMDFIPARYTSYHWDPVKFGQFLKSNYCLNKGVKLVVGEITDTKTTKEGLEEIVLNGSQCFKADLFIDCSGSESLLLGKAMKVPFISYKDILINDSVIACHVPYKNPSKEITIYNTVTGYNNGWLWHTPLWSGISSGYVYSSKYVSHGQALNEYIEYLKNKFSNRSLKGIELKERKFKSGCHDQIWIKNVCAIGSSAGEIEPLQNNSLFATHDFLRILIKFLWCKEDINQFDKDAFNHTCITRFIDLAEFVSLPFRLTVREDTKYWKFLTNHSVDPPNLLEGENLMGEGAMLDYKRGYKDLVRQRMREEHLENGLACMAFGMHWFSRDWPGIAWWRYNNDVNWHKGGFNNSIKELNRRRQGWKKIAANAIPIFKYLKKEFYSA